MVSPTCAFWWLVTDFVNDKPELSFTTTQGESYLNLVALVCWTTNHHVVYDEIIQHNAHLPEMFFDPGLSSRCSAIYSRGMSTEQAPTAQKAS